MKKANIQLEHYEGCKDFGNKDKRIHRIIGLVKEEPKGVLLDVGCGDGSSSEELVKDGWSIFGLELSPKNVTKARKKGINAVVGNAEEKLPYNDDMFDVMIAGEVIEHLTNPKNFLEECYRVLKPNGVLIMTTPNVCFLSSRIKVMFGKLPYASAPFHFQYFTLSSLKKLLKESGFTIERAMGNMIFGECIFDRLKVPFLKFISTYPAKFLPTLSANLIIKSRKVSR
jgi:methionine biosynthesis protein MetW